MGYPTETLEEMRETISFASELPLTRAIFSNFLPIPGTEVFDYLKERGEIDMLDWKRLIQSDVPYAPDGISKKRLKKMQKSAYVRFYLRRHIMRQLLKEVHSLSQLKYLMRRALAHFAPWARFPTLSV